MHKSLLLSHHVYHFTKTLLCWYSIEQALNDESSITPRNRGPRTGFLSVLFGRSKRSLVPGRRQTDGRALPRVEPCDGFAHLPPLNKKADFGHRCVIVSSEGCFPVSCISPSGTKKSRARKWPARERLARTTSSTSPRLSFSSLALISELWIQVIGPPPFSRWIALSRSKSDA